MNLSANSSPSPSTPWPETDVSNDEAILLGDQAIGYISSGGYAHHAQKSMALGYVPIEHAAAGTALEVEILGERYPAQVPRRTDL